ncbi:MAG: transglycosylase SLT domain-containing protein [Desulfobacterales bacterium]|jgi:soluble lytic murein transglycosylase-like protein|nr:transglycosylase SLT domain-containing protein [Desulfobacterales bacterium]MCU0584882.1 transglycosylase SLT domain-containing protein [Desulfobacterales bacterium]
MAVDRSLTIRDYLEPTRMVGGRSRAAGEPNQGRFSFRDLLVRESSQKAAAPAAGMSLADYFARPVPASRSSRLSAAAARREPAGPAPAPGSSEPSRSTAASQEGRRSDGEPRNPPPAAFRRDSSGSRLKNGPSSSSNGAVEQAIGDAAAAYNLAPGLIRSVIRAESGFRVDAVSRAGAKGLMQLMPETAAELGVSDPFDIRQNIDGGARYLRRMLDRFDGDLRLALSAYNAGPGAVEKYAGEVPYAETRSYVERVLRFAGLSA